MNLYNRLMSELAGHADRLGFDPLTVEQGSPEWFKMRAGVFTASKSDKFSSGLTTDTFKSYFYEQVAEIVTGIPQEEVSAKPLAWGKENESAARATFEFISGLKVYQVPFVYKDMAAMFGCSPDGVCSDDNGLELKCPWSSREHIKFIDTGTPRPEYVKQCQYSMWITGANKWHFGSYDPRVKLRNIHSITIERDEKLMVEFDKRAAEVSQMVANLLAKFN